MLRFLILFVIIPSIIALGRHHRHKNNTKRIVGGTYANIVNYPYQVVLNYWRTNKYDFLCGGSLISTQHVLTAGHCVKDFEKNNYLIRTGFDGQWNVVPDQISYVDQIFLHEQFYFLNDAPINDIALMKLPQQLTLNSYVQTIPLPIYWSSPSSSISTISGFGKTKSSDAQPSPYLMKSDVSIISNTDCKAAIKVLVPNVEPPIMDTNICTMVQPTKGSCSGDSGGPLAQDGHLIGVVSWGVSPCESVKNPTVYTEVSKYVDWVNMKMAL